MSNNTMIYVIHGEFVYEEGEWFNSPDSERYDDIKRVEVDLDHPTYPDDDEKLYEDLVNYWSTGVKPSYVI